MKFLMLAVLLHFIAFQNETIISKIQQKFEDTKDLKSDFVQSSNNVNVMKGKFYFFQKNNYKIELEKNEIICNGKTIWNIDKSKKKVIISNIEDDPLAFSLREYIYSYPSKCKVSEEKIDANNYLITLDAANSDLNFKQAKLWVNEKYLITKILVEDLSNSKLEFAFSNIDININLSKSFFQYNENKEYKIIDLR